MNFGSGTWAGPAGKRTFGGRAVDAVSPGKPTRKRTGRRVGPTVSNQSILQIARAQFSQHGYEGTTMRTIAHEAGVDTALIHHFFLTKEGLFEAAVGDALRPPDLVEKALEGPRAAIGERTVRHLVSYWDEPDNRERLVGVLRSVTALDGAAAEVRGFLGARVLYKLTAALGNTNPELRAALGGAQLMGLATMRYIFRFGPLASLPPAKLATLTGRTLQTYLTGAL
jgi:AcrR family transcriptional regulator